MLITSTVCSPHYLPLNQLPCLRRKTSPLITSNSFVPSSQTPADCFEWMVSYGVCVQTLSWRLFLSIFLLWSWRQKNCKHNCAFDKPEAFRKVFVGWRGQWSFGLNVWTTFHTKENPIQSPLLLQKEKAPLSAQPKSLCQKIFTRRDRKRKK